MQATTCMHSHVVPCRASLRSDAPQQRSFAAPLAPKVREHYCDCCELCSGPLDHRSCGQPCQITHNPPTLPPHSIQARKAHVCRVAEEVSTNGVATSATTVMDYDELTDILRCAALLVHACPTHQ